MPSLPYFKFYPTDFMGDTGRLTAEQRGAYIAILCELWTSGGTIPLDHAELATLTRVPARRWPKVWEKLVRYFEFDGQYISHGRLAALRDQTVETCQKRKIASDAGVAAKRLKKQRRREPNG